MKITLNSKLHQILYKKYKQKLGSEWYGLGDDDRSDEFLNGFLSNSSFRSELEKHDKNLFQRIWEAISGVIKEFFGKIITDYQKIYQNCRRIL